MGCCYNKLFKCAECYCYICASCGVFYHMYEEGNLDCDTVNCWCRYTTEVIIEDIKEDIRK